jgi:hypothetical protein
MIMMSILVTTWNSEVGPERRLPLQKFDTVDRLDRPLRSRGIDLADASADPRNEGRGLRR